MVTNVVDFFRFIQAVRLVGPTIKIHYFITDRVFRIQSFRPVSATVNLEYVLSLCYKALSKRGRAFTKLLAIY